MINPDSPVMNQIAEFLDMSENDAKLRIQASLKAIYDAKMKLKAGDRDRLSIRVFDGFPTVSIFMIDPNLGHGRIHADFKLFKAPRNESFMFELSGNEKRCYINIREAAFAQVEVANEFGPRTHLKGFQLATTNQREKGK